MNAAKSKACKDCEPGSKRPAGYPGPRCATHHRLFKRSRKEANHDRVVVQVYGLEPGEYAKIYEKQGGVCYICRRAKGTTKKLAVDHNHKTGRVRGLLCGPCNRYLGYVHDSQAAYARGVAYLENDQ